MDIKNISNELKHAPLDKNANIRLIRLAGDDTLSTYAAEVAAMSSLQPHYHKYGVEIYQIFSGSGIMKTGSINGIALEWTAMSHVEAGDFFSIEAHTVHQIINNTSNPLILIFSCPSDHLSTDRFFIQKKED
ncbi:MAG: cupin domain-containing protein [Spirochaetes bacterium]|nr:cupin domain-containing protein [Spirochaetota bacterium]